MMKTLTTRNLMLVAVFAALTITTGSSAASQAGTNQAASVSSQISYQGKISDSSGNPLTGSHDFKFQLYTAASGGTLVWEQNQPGVAVQNGLLEVKLAVDPTDFDGKALWLAITVDGQLLSPRQELLPVPYALGLKPGAAINGDSYYGLSSSTTGSGAGLLGDNSGGGGDGVQGESDGRAGVYGHGSGSQSFGGLFLSDSSIGAYAQGSDDLTADLELGGTASEDDGLLTSDMDLPSSDLVLVSNDAIALILDENNDEEGDLLVFNGTDEVVFSVNEYGDLSVQGHITSAGPTCWEYDFDTTGSWAIGLPDYCLDGFCQVYIWSDGTFGAFGPGLLWPVQYMQDTSDDSWIGGPNIAIGGVAHSDGEGNNGDGVQDYVHAAGVTTSGGYIRVADDGTAENSASQWTVEVQLYPAELTQGRVYICPLGQPVTP